MQSNEVGIKPQDRETLKLETAAALYDVKLSTLRLMAVQERLKTQKVGKHRFVTREEMDRVFKGEESKKSSAKSTSK